MNSFDFEQEQHTAEIERKFRLLHAADVSILGAGVPILQGYLITENGEERVRRKGDRYYWTVKGEGKLSRSEFEIEIPEWVFNILWPHTESRRIEKIRHTIPYHGLTLEIDIYSGNCAGLTILECEFPDKDAAAGFRLPEWADGAIDVTADPRYKNRSLALHGLPLP